MEERLVNQLKRIYHDTKQAINECDFLNKQELDQLTLSQDEEKTILSVNGSESSLIKAACLLRELHARFLRTFVLSAFDLTWDMITTRKRFEYAKQKELELYNSLMNISNLKQEQIRKEIRNMIDNLRAGNLDSRSHLSRSIDSGGGSSTQSLENISSRSELQLHRQEIQELVLQQLNAAIASKLVGSVESLRDSYVGTLERCLASLEQNCLENNEPPHALLALRQILNAAYRVEVSVESSSSLLRVLWERMKFLLANSVPLSLSSLLGGGRQHHHNENNSNHHHQNGQTSSGTSTTNSTSTTTTTSAVCHQSNDSWIGANQFGCCIIDGEWKRQQALIILDSLSESRLAKTICSQFRARLKSSHEQFLQSIRDLEAQHAGRLQHTEELRLRIRKMHAPRMAKFALESTSLIDLILYGMPCLEREIGRGQYGVVYACESWAGHSPCAVKSVVPPDDKHWYDLAMEFYYTRCIPEHERIVNIYGSVIDHSYGSGSTPAVLLIMQRLDKDLYSAIRSGIDWLSRLQVAIDVVEGIRFLHNQGLVHRDIKLKNILLDSQNRAKVTDLGFCKPEAMMSGSVVGTPIHMSPELFSGRYDNSVDVYAFGILFWYICAGHVRLPHIFEQCQTRDQLWNCVRRGVRPERLPQFDDECWQLMVQCWDGDRHKRPHLGDVEIKLRQIHARYA